MRCFLLAIFNGIRCAPSRDIVTSFVWSTRGYPLQCSFFLCVSVLHACTIYSCYTNCNFFFQLQFDKLSFQCRQAYLLDINLLSMSYQLKKINKFWQLVKDLCRRFMFPFTSCQFITESPRFSVIFDLKLRPQIMIEKTKIEMYQ